MNIKTRIFFKKLKIKKIETDSKIQFTRRQKYRIFKILRLKEGRYVELFGGSGQFVLGIISKEKASFIKIIRMGYIQANNNKIIIAQSILVKSKLEHIIRNSTELGISKIFIFISSRSNFLYNIKLNKRILNRFISIVSDVSRQSGRYFVPKVVKMLNFFDLIYYCNKFSGLIAICNPNAKYTISYFLKKRYAAKINLLFVIGPEGGFDSDEINLLIKKGILCRVGVNVLKVEIISMIILSTMQTFFGYL